MVSENGHGLNKVEQSLVINLGKALFHVSPF